MRKRKDGPCKKHDEYDYTIEDTRAYGLYTHHGNGKGRWVKIDPKKFQKENGVQFTEQQLQVINKRRTHYFQPRKDRYNDYFCNEFCNAIREIKNKWEKHFKPLITKAIERIEKPRELTPGDCDLLMCGIIEPDEANSLIIFENMMRDYKYKRECIDITVSLYAQFLHLFASQIEAITVKILDKCKLDKDRDFNRNRFYDYAAGRDVNLKQLPSFKYYDKLYCLWHFIKHNSVTTLKKLKEKYPEVLRNSNSYHQGDLAIYYLKLTDELIYELIEGCDSFFKECCESLFGEKYDEAQWNHNQYFLDIVKKTINKEIDPWEFDE